jgi:integrase
MEQQNAPYITQVLAIAWAQQAADIQPVTRAHRLGMVRGFARYRSASDPRTQVPATGLFSCRSKRPQPYLYSDDEIRRLLDAALSMRYRHKRDALHPFTFYCLFGLLSVSGMRLSEARNLELQDVDLAEDVLTIRGSKFGKSRLLPLHASTGKVLADYLMRRARHWAGRDVSSYVFVSNRGNRLDSGEIRRTFHRLSRQIGLRGESDHEGPRLHDMRHVFATRTLVDLFRAGQDPARRLPVLSAYLGHAHIADTQWYLSASPELMLESMRRLEQLWESRS